MERGAQDVLCHRQRDLSEVFKQGPNVLGCASEKTVPVAVQRRWAWRKGQLGSCDSLSGSGWSGGDGTEKAGFSRMSCVMGKGRQEGGMAPRVFKASGADAFNQKMESSGSRAHWERREKYNG